MPDEDGQLDDAPEEVAFLRELARVDVLAPPDTLRTGDRIARFTVTRSLGAGGMGAVYEAKDETLGRLVALKVMRRAIAEARARFIQEARAAAAVSHPNLITIHEVGEADGRAFIVMELVRGQTLRAVMAARPERDESLRILRACVRGVAAAHAAGIVHRDLKPENVMIADDGNVKVLDFGIARLAAAADGATAVAVTGTGAVIGTPQYMSPEQALGIEVDARSDVYSFGVLAYEVLVGTRPGPNPPPAKVSPDVDAILARCLEADPAKRFGDAGAVRDAFDGTPSTPARRRRPWVAIGALLAIAVVIAGALGAWRLSRSPAQRGRRLEAAPTVKAATREALAAYQAGFQQFRDGMFLEAVQELERAVELDPSFAAAHLRLGLMKKLFHDPGEARRSFSIAVTNRQQLDARDQALLHATEPTVVRDPYDYAEAQRRLAAALEKFPGDVELLYYLGLSYSELGRHAELPPILDRMQAVDPTAPVVWAARAITLLYLGDRAGAREAAVECKRLAPTQGGCAFELQKILDDQGACSDLETVLRAWQAASANNPRVPRAIGRTMLAQGHPLEGVREHFGRALRLLPEPAREGAREQDDLEIAFQVGDLATYERMLRALLERGWNPAVAANLIDLLEETGRRSETRALAETYFAADPAAFTPRGTSDLDLYHDRTGIMLATLARTGAIDRDELARRRDDWVRELDGRIGHGFKRGIWAQAYAAATHTREEALAAVAAMPAELPPTFWFAGTYGAIGRTLALAERHAEALPYLVRATRLCFERDPRDFYFLGLAQEGTGDTTSACASYRTLLARWPDPKPRSLAVEAARARRAAIACPPDGP